MLTGTLITAAGFLPIGLAKSAAGEYTFSMFSVDALALMISWIVAVLFTPYIGFMLLKVKPHAHARRRARAVRHAGFYAASARIGRPGASNGARPPSR